MGTRCLAGTERREVLRAFRPAIGGTCDKRYALLMLLTLAVLRATWRDSGLQIPLVLFLSVIAESGFA